MIYFLLPLFFCFFYFIKDKYIQSAVVFIFLMAIVMFAGLRWETGTDWIPYYENFLEPDNRIDFEVGYYWYVSAIRFFTDDYTIFLLFTSAIPTVFVYLGCKKTIGNDINNTLLLALLMFYSYYYLGSFFGAERRIIAIGLCFFALVNYIYGRSLFALILILFSALFHASSLFTLLIFMSRRISLRCLLIILLISAVIILPLSPYLSAIIEGMIEYVPLDIFKIKLVAYTQNAAEYGEFNLAGALKRMFVAVILIYVYFANASKLGDDFLTLLKIYILGVLFYLVLSPISAMFSVLTIYLTISEILLIPIVLAKSQIFLQAPYLYLIFILYLMYQIYSILNSYPDLFFPYINALSGGTRWGLH